MSRYGNEPNGRNCVTCNRKLRGRQRLYCSRPCTEIHYRNPVKDRLKWAAWYSNPENRRNHIARIVRWKRDNADKASTANRKWRHGHVCAFCGGQQRDPWALACKKCTERFGLHCKRNPACGVAGTHKHCPCFAPVTPKAPARVIEPCPECQEDMRQLNLTLTELFRRNQDAEEAA